jgi:DNA polymerase III sliding clamp (beta) subunit (PCNA family)
MNLTKKQVKTFLDVISSDDSRPVLTHAKIDTFDGQAVLVGTDSYKLAALQLKDTILPAMGNLVPRTELLKWYKLASNKDYLTETELAAMSTSEENIGKYPEWQRLVPDAKDMTALTSINVNALYLATMQELTGDYAKIGLEWQFYGALAPIVARRDGNIYIVMPLKK